jgi:hypothetical protein
VFLITEESVASPCLAQVLCKAHGLFEHERRLQTVARARRPQTHRHSSIRPIKQLYPCRSSRSCQLPVTSTPQTARAHGPKPRTVQSTYITAIAHLSSKQSTKATTWTLLNNSMSATSSTSARGRVRTCLIFCPLTHKLMLKESACVHVQRMVDIDTLLVQSDCKFVGWCTLRLER